MKDLIERLRYTASKGVSVWGDLQIEAANALERLTTGDVELPAYSIPDTRTSDNKGGFVCYTEAQLKDYGDRRAAAAALAERNRCADVAVDAIAFNGGTIQMEAHIRDAIRKGTP